MRVLSCLAARGGLFAMLMIVLAVLAAPTPGFADTLGARSGIAAASEDHDVVGWHPAHGGAADRSCHPDPTCSPAAIVVPLPILEAQGFEAARQPFAGTAIRGRAAPVDLPPPRTRTLSRPDFPNDTRT